VIQIATYDGHLWIGWVAAFGLGIAWVACLFRGDARAGVRGRRGPRSWRT
jgi:hypothetical protein